MPVRIQRRRTKGWRMPKGAVYVGRGSHFGDPYMIARHPSQDLHSQDLHSQDLHSQDLHYDAEAVRYVDTPGAAVSGYRELLESNLSLVERVKRELRGKDLACWCPLDAPCHADVLLEIANTKDVPTDKRWL